jgi:hypothetical protein
MSFPSARIAVKPEFARSGWSNTMTGRSLRKREETDMVSSTRSLLTWGRRRFGRGFGWF